MGYKFSLNELRPVFFVTLIEDYGIDFWYEGEDPDLPPTQKPSLESHQKSDEVIPRPPLKDARTIYIYRELGTDECVRHINKRIANFIIDEFEDVIDECPLILEKLYLEKIDKFYTWFWNNRTKRDAKIFQRFLRHIQSVRQKQNLPPTWYSLKEAAAYSRTGVTKLRELIDCGKLKSYRVDDAKSKSTILLHRKDIDALIMFDRSSGLTKRQQERLATYGK